MGRVLNANGAGKRGRPFIVGLTGTFGSGKSTVSRMLREHGVEVLDADAMARDAVLPGQPALEVIREEFGEEFIADDGGLDRRRMAQCVFASPARRRRLEAIIHPEVKKAMDRGIAAATCRFQNEGEPVLMVLDVPLLFEAGLEEMVDRTVLVTIGEAERFRRVRSRDGLSESEIVLRLGAQWPQSVKKALTDDIIDNTGVLKATRRRVDGLVAEWFEQTHAILKD